LHMFWLNKSLFRLRPQRLLFTFSAAVLYLL
jgi:hypothetical protein